MLATTKINELRFKVFAYCQTISASTHFKTTYLIILIFFSALNNNANAQNPNLHYAFNIGSTTGDAAYSIALDGASNMYVTGAFSGSADFDPGPGTAILNAFPPGVSIFVAKYNANGTYQWAFGMGNANGSNFGNSIKVDGSDNVYVTGMFGGTVDFDPGPGTANLTGNGAGDIFVAKYNSSGVYQWAFKIGSTDWDRGQSLEVDGSGNIFVTGYFRLTADFDPGPGTANLTVVGGEDIFVAKYNSSGVYQWAFNIGSQFDDHGFSLVLDGSSNVYVTGQFGGTADFDPGPGVANLTILTSFPGHNIFVAKYNSSGIYQWAFRVGGTLDDNAYSIAIDGSANVYITGWYQGPVDFDPGPGTANLNLYGAFLAKYNSSGIYQWSIPISSSVSGLVNWGYGVFVDFANNVYITGQFSNTADFDPGPGTANLIALGQPDIFIAKYTALGAYQWAFNVGGPWTGSYLDAGTSITVDNLSNVYVTGVFIDTADFDPGSGTTILSCNGVSDAFVAKYSPCLLMSTPGPITGNINVCSGSSNTYSIPAVTGATSYTWTLPSGWTGNSTTTSIVATAGASGGIILVKANNACGSSPEQTLAVTVNTTVTPNVNITVSPPGSICAGTSVTFAATATNAGGGTVNYNFKVNGISVQNGVSNTFTTSTLLNGNVVSCDITISGGTCLTSTVVSSNTITMSVTALVTPSVGIVASSTTICAGTSVTFTANPTNGGANPSYQWKVNGVNAGANSPIFTTTTLANGDLVTVNMTSSLTCASPTSATSNTIAIVVNPNISPTVNISANPSGVVCAGASVVFTAVPTNAGGGVVTYDFKVNGTSVQSSSSNIFTTTTLSNGNAVSCDITIVGGTCLTSTSASSNSINMVVNPNITPALNITANPSGTICTGTMVTFTAATTNTGGGTVNYNFKINGASVQNGPLNTFATTSLVNGNNVTCDITISSGTCLAVNTASSNTVIISVNSSPNPTINITANPAGAICTGTPVTFTAIPANVGTTPTFQWQLNGINVSGGGLTYIGNNLSDGDKVNCVMNTVTSCSVTPFVYSDTLIMVVKAVPVISFNPPAPTIFAGNSIQLNATATGNIASYLWTPSIGLNNQSISNPVASPTVTTTYNLKVVASNSCYADKTITVKVLREIYIPNSFTPNGDGKNDVFRIPPGTSLNLKYFIIYDRYGNEVFKTTDINTGWDGTYKGTKLPNGAYTYLIKGSDSKGEVFLNGSILIIR